MSALQYAVGLVLSLSSLAAVAATPFVIVAARRTHLPARPTKKEH
ncbi:hypothetical protein [Streptomyces niveus]